MTKNSGFSLVEMQVALIAAAIMALAIGAVTSTGIDLFNKSRQEASSFDDMSYSFRMIQGEVRKSSSISSATCSGTDWVAGSSCLNVVFGATTGVFGVKQVGSSERRFVYSVSGADQILFRMTTEDNNLAFSIPSLSANQVTVTLGWRVNKQDYSVAHTVTRRLP